MKNKWRIIVVFCFVGLLLTSISISKGAYQVNVGDIFTYDIVEGQVSYTYGASSGTGNGYPIDDQHFLAGTQVDVNITDVETSFVNIDVIAGPKTEGVACDDWMFEMMVYLVYYPLEVPYELMYLEPADIQDGLSLMDFWIADPAELNSNLGTITSISYPDVFSTIVSLDIIQHESQIVTDGSIITLDWIFNVKVTNSTQDTDYTGSCLFKITYNTTTGVLQGYNYDFKMSGRYNGTDCEMTIKQQVEIEGYDLPDFQYTVSDTNGLGGFVDFFTNELFLGLKGWHVVVIAVGVLVLITVIITVVASALKKRKR